MTFGERLKQLMDDRNITQRQISKELNIAVTTLNGYANDYREPDFLTLSLLANYFNVSADYLLGISTVPIMSDIAGNHDAQRLLYFYQCLSPEMKSLLIEQAKLLLKFDSPQDKMCIRDRICPLPKRILCSVPFLQSSPPLALLSTAFFLTVLTALTALDIM